jgi:DNA-binding MarR family transcriptional regulator
MTPDKIIYLISRIQEKANAFILRELKRHNLIGLAPSHGDILYLLIQEERLNMTEIADRIHRRKPTVTVLVNKLIQEGYVEKQVDPQDERVHLISLTAKGEGLKSAVNKISNDLLKSVYKGFSKEEQTILMMLLTKIFQNL